MSRTLTIVAATAMLTGCTTQVVNLKNEFDVRTAQVQTEAGSGSIAGSAYMLKRDGSPQTCAGNEVRLVPATAYAQERFSRMYDNEPTFNSTSLKSVDDVLFRPQKFFPDPPAYHLATKVTTCDDLGSFKFTGVKDGDYFVNTSIYWWDDVNHGGTLARRVVVENGSAPYLTLTPLVAVRP